MPATSIGVVCGEIGVDSGTVIEAIDFDIKHGEKFPPWESLVREMLPLVYESLYIESTPSGGRHVVYMYQVPSGQKVDGNLKLSIVKDAQGKKVAPIETRGQGGYIIVAPSKGYSALCGDIRNLPLLTFDQRESLIKISRSFGMVEVKSPRPQKPPPPGVHSDDTIEDFNGLYDVIVLLEKHGWESVRQTTSEHGTEYFLLKPGGKSAPDATYNDKLRVLYVFSSACDPFESDKGYSPFGVYTLLEHGGDHKAAYKAARLLGYGTITYLTTNEQGDNGRAKAKIDIFTTQLENMAVTSLYGGIAMDQINFRELSLVTSGSITEDVARGIFLRVYQEKASFFGFVKFTTQAKAEVLIKDKFKLFKNSVSGSLFCQNGSDKLHKISPLEVWHIVGRSIEVNKNVVISLCDIKEVSKPFDPFLDYLESLQWDGQDEIGKFTQYVKVEEQQFHDSQIERMFIRCIHCMLGRGENRFVWTYIGGQYIGKSYLIRFFCPPALKEYYTEEKPTGDKDGAIRLQENAFYNWEELQSSTNHDINQMKAMISKAANKIRVPYAAVSETAPRRANFFASTNEDHFLTDDENTRWLTFKIIEIDQRYAQNININNVWAQAYHKYKSGFDFGIKRDELLSQHEVTDKYRHVTSEEELVLQYFEKVDFDDTIEKQNKGIYISATTMIAKLSATIGRSMTLKKIPLGRVLSKKRYVKKRDNTGTYTYWVIDKSEDGSGVAKNPYYAAGRVDDEKNMEPLPF